jgi:hypothetical protein
MLKNSEGSSVRYELATTVLIYKDVTSGALTETTTGHCILLAEFVISLAKIFVAQDLVGFTDLKSARMLVSSSGCFGVGACPYRLESFMGGLIAGVLVYSSSVRMSDMKQVFTKIYQGG